MMVQRMPNIKVLIVEGLAESSWFRAGSRIIITSRDRQVLVAHGVHNIHDVSTLSDEDAIRLLSRYAFKTECPAQGYEELSKEVLRYAAGLPLTIKTLSSSLRARPTDVWEDAIKRLKEIPWGDTLKILKISYDALDKDQKEIFLHVACLLKGENKKNAIRMLESLGFHAKFGLEDLEQKSLITFRDDDKRLVMHDHIEEMGKHIVGSSDTYKLLWNKDEIEHIIKKDMGTEAIRGIKLMYSNLHPDKISQSLRKMSNLRYRYLYIEWRGDVAYKFDEAGKYLPNSLQYLNWPFYPYSYLPKTFQADNLVHMEIRYSNIRRLWKPLTCKLFGEKKVLPKLRLLDLSYSKKLETFDSAMTPNLEELVLRRCEKFNISDECSSHLKKLHLSESTAFKKLSISNECRNLEKLDLSGCTSLREVQMHGEWPSLKTLHLSHIKSRKLGRLSYLEKFKSSSLEELRLSFGDMNRLPDADSIYMLKHLRVLHLYNCFKLEQLPEDLDRLECLEELIIFCCESLVNIPACICNMTRLRRLNISGCYNLKQLPEDVDRLERLEDLILSYCSSLVNIPDCICNMTRLKTLDLSNCEKLEKLPDEFTRLQSLERLDDRGIYS